MTGEVSRDFDINPYSYALNTSRTMDPNELYVRNYAPFNIFRELENNYLSLDVVDMKFQGELKYKPISKVELAVLGAYKYSTTTNAATITDQSNQAWAYRAMDDATMRDANPWLYTDPDKANSLPFSVLEKGGFYRETKYKMNSWDFRATASYNDVYNKDHIVNLFGGLEINSLDRSRSYFNGVGMQYDMGYLLLSTITSSSSWRRRMVNIIVWIIHISVRLLSLVLPPILIRVATQLMVPFVMRVPISWVRVVQLVGCLLGTCLEHGMLMRRVGLLS